jgi:preprotein translocase subunit SecG
VERFIKGNYPKAAAANTEEGNSKKVKGKSEAETVLLKTSFRLAFAFFTFTCLLP